MLAQLVLSSAQFSRSRSWQRPWIRWYVFILFKSWSYAYYLVHLSNWLIFQVNQTPIPLLFMRTIIQAIDAFPSLVISLFLPFPFTIYICCHNITLTFILCKSWVYVIHEFMPCSFSGWFCHGNTFQTCKETGMDTSVRIRHLCVSYSLSCVLFQVYKSVVIIRVIWRQLIFYIWLQVWRMPKLWVGFLKCASQTQPHSFHVLLQVSHLFMWRTSLAFHWWFWLQLSWPIFPLQLPPPQLESALNKYANIKGPLATYASQPSIKASLSRYIIVHLIGPPTLMHGNLPSLLYVWG